MSRTDFSIKINICTVLHKLLTMDSNRTKIYWHAAVLSTYFGIKLLSWILIIIYLSKLCVCST